MIVCDSPPFVVLQPWKVASTTLYRRLQIYDCGRYPQGIVYDPKLGRDITRHLPQRDLAQFPEAERKYKRVTFLRNPYDRLYSGFLQRQKRVLTAQDRGDITPALREEKAAIETGFHSFLEYYADPSSSSQSVPGLYQQYEYVYWDGAFAVDFVGFLETFEASYAQICDTLEIQGEQVLNANVSNPDNILTSTTLPSDARFRYIHQFDASTLALANSIYAEDFEGLCFRMLLPTDNASEYMELSPFSDAFISEIDMSMVIDDRAFGWHRTGGAAPAM